MDKNERLALSRQRSTGAVITDGSMSYVRIKYKTDRRNS